MKLMKVPVPVIFITILLLFISSCGGSGSDPVDLPLDAPTATVVPGNTATINGLTPIVISFSDTMDPATLALTGTLTTESNGGAWSDNTNVNDTLTIAPTTSWSDGAHTLIINADSIITASLPTVTLNYTVDATLPVASIVPASGSTIVGNDFIVITFNESMNTTSLVPTGSLWNKGDGGVWSTTSNSDDTFTVGPASLWDEGAANLNLGILDLAGNAVTLNLSYTVAAASCIDSILNQDETDTDCGGATCSGCADGDSCIVNTDCVSVTCDSSSSPGICVAVCLDTDNDGVCDADDPCPLDNPDDRDGDGVCDTDDACPLDNPDDIDGDGYCNSDDCDPGDFSTNPGADEVCGDAVDNDCDGATDAADAECAAICGDGFTTLPEDCDDGGESASCDADCTSAVCGDGTVNTAASEQCDDANTIDGDGCDSSCQLEP